MTEVKRLYGRELGTLKVWSAPVLMLEMMGEGEKEVWVKIHACVVFLNWPLITRHKQQFRNLVSVVVEVTKSLTLSIWQ